MLLKRIVINIWKTRSKVVSKLLLGMKLARRSFNLSKSKEMCHLSPKHHIPVLKSINFCETQFIFLPSSHSLNAMLFILETIESMFKTNADHSYLIKSTPLGILNTETTSYHANLSAPHMWNSNTIQTQFADFIWYFTLIQVNSRGVNLQS